MNRLGKILTLGLKKKRAWQLPIIAVFRGPRTGSSSVAKGASSLEWDNHKFPPRRGGVGIVLHPAGVQVTRSQ